MSVVLNSSLHESIFFELVLYLFFNSEYFNTLRGVTPQNYAIGMVECTKMKNVAFLLLSLTALLLRLLLRNVQS
jgi:hypothetical protein